MKAEREPEPIKHCEKLLRVFKALGCRKFLGLEPQTGMGKLKVLKLFGGENADIEAWRYFKKFGGKWMLKHTEKIVYLNGNLMWLVEVPNAIDEDGDGQRIQR